MPRKSIIKNTDPHYFDTTTNGKKPLKMLHPNYNFIQKRITNFRYCLNSIFKQLGTEIFLQYVSLKHLINTVVFVTSFIEKKL